MLLLDYEGLGIVVIEVLVVGLLVVVIDCSFNIVLLIDGVGWWVLVGDVGVLVDVMLIIVDDLVDVVEMCVWVECFMVEVSG